MNWIRSRKNTEPERRKTSIENAEEVVYERRRWKTEVCFLMDRFGYMGLIDKNDYERNKDAAWAAESQGVFYLHE